VDRFDEHRGADCSARNAQRVLRHHEDVIPESRLAVAFELWKIELRTRASGQELTRVVEEIEPEVEEAR
jgi:hypothetical protein